MDAEGAPLTSTSGAAHDELDRGEEGDAEVETGKFGSMDDDDDNTNEAVWPSIVGK